MIKKEWNKLDKIWSEKVKENAGYKCEICGTKDRQLHSHHFCGRRHTALRWVLLNGFCLCASHHTMGRESAHEDPQWFIEEARRMRGEIWYKEIATLKNRINKKSYEENLLLMEMPLADINKSYLLEPYSVYDNTKPNGNKTERASKRVSTKNESSSRNKKA